MLNIIYLIKETGKNIIFDFKQPIGYLLPALIVVLVIVTGYKIWKKENAQINVAGALLIIYVIVLLRTTFFSREPGSRNGIDLNLFSTWGQTSVAHAYFIENIIMFIPFGILTPMVWKYMRKMRHCVLIGFLCSCAIELSQLVTQRGYCQLDDVMTNTLGALCGWLVWGVIHCMVVRIRKFRES